MRTRLRARQAAGVVAAGLAMVVLAGAARAVVLSYTVKVGDAWKYKSTINAEGTLTMQGPLGAQPIPVTLYNEELRTLAVTEAAGESNWFESRRTSGKVNANVAGQALDVGQELPGLDYRMKVNARGEVKELTSLKGDKPGKDEGGGLDLQFGQLTALGQLVGFPEGDVAVGQTWTQEIPISTKDGKTLQAKVENKLLSLENGDAKIETHYDMPIPPTEGKLKFGMEIPIKLEGRAVGTSTSIWSTAKSCMVRSEGSATMDVKLFLVGMGDEPANGHFMLSIHNNLAE